jgi:hypothetical protein
MPSILLVISMGVSVVNGVGGILMIKIGEITLTQDLRVVTNLYSSQSAISVPNEAEIQPGQQILQILIAADVLTSGVRKQSEIAL